MNRDNKVFRCDYYVEKADNGFVFKVYDITTDATKSSVAHTAEDLALIILEWHSQKLAGWVKAMGSGMALTIVKK